MVAYALDGALLSFGYITAYRVKIGHLREWTFDAYYMRQLLKESLPLLLTGVAVIVYQRIDQVMIGQMVNKEALGYFSVSSRFVEILIFIPLILGQTITPILVKAREKSQNDYKTKAQQFMNMTVWLSLISAILTSCVSYWLVRLTFGQAYLPAVPVLQVMSFKSAAVALSTTAGAMLITEGLQRYAIFRDSLGCAVSITLNYLLLPHYGIMAAAFVSIVSTVAAGYIADAFIPAYRHLFLYQTRTLLTGWRDILSVRQFLATPK
jgi:O-antigen/teichoic acid export membrane protein